MRGESARIAQTRIGINFRHGRCQNPPARISADCTPGMFRAAESVGHRDSHLPVLNWDSELSPPPPPDSLLAGESRTARCLCDEMLDHIGDVVAATPLPVNADFLNGFADEPEEWRANVTRCIATGRRPFDRGLHRPGRCAALRTRLSRLTGSVRPGPRSTPPGSIVLTGRCEAFLVGQADPLRTALRAS